MWLGWRIERLHTEFWCGNVLKMYKVWSFYGAEWPLGANRGERPLWRKGERGGLELAQTCVQWQLAIVLVRNLCLIFFFHWRYSPLWALACRTMSFHFLLSATNSLHLLTPSSQRSLSTSSFHLFLGLPHLLVPSSSWVKIFLGILSTFILSRWPNHLTLCPFIHFTTFSPLLISSSSRFVQLFLSPFSYLGMSYITRVGILILATPRWIGYKCCWSDTAMQQEGWVLPLRTYLMGAVHHEMGMRSSQLIVSRCRDTA